MPPSFFGFAAWEIEDFNILALGPGRHGESFPRTTTVYAAHGNVL